MGQADLDQKMTWLRADIEPRGIPPYVGYIGMCGPKGIDFGHFGLK